VHLCSRARSRDGPVVELPRFDSQKYEAITGALVRVEGIPLSSLSSSGQRYSKLKIPGRYRRVPSIAWRCVNEYESLSVRSGILGGCTYVIKIAGDKQYSPVHITPSHDPNTPPDVAEDIERKAREFRWYPSLFCQESRGAAGSRIWRMTSPYTECRPRPESFTAKSTQPGINPIGNGARSVMGSKS